MQGKTRIVVGYDREVGGREALALGCDFAHARDCDLLAVNVRRHVPGPRCLSWARAGNASTGPTRAA